MIFGRIRLTGTLKAITALTDFAPVWSRNVTWIPVGSAFPPYDMVRIPPQHPIRLPPANIGSTHQGFGRFDPLPSGKSCSLQGYPLDRPAGTEEARFARTRQAGTLLFPLQP